MGRGGLYSECAVPLVSAHRGTDWRINCIAVNCKEEAFASPTEVAYRPQAQERVSAKIDVIVARTARTTMTSRPMVVLAALTTPVS